MRDSSGLLHTTAVVEPVLLGAGGYIAGFIAAADNGDMACGGDQIGCWSRPLGANAWKPLVDVTVLGENGLAGGSGNAGSFTGDICRADSTRIWAVICCLLVKFDKVGEAWTGTAMSGGPWTSCNSNATNTLRPQRMRCDPDYKDAVLFGTKENKAVACVNGTVTEIAYATASAPILVEVDRTSSQVGGIRQRWFLASANSGVLMSTTGPAGPFTAMTGAPSNPTSIFCDADGKVWVTQGGANGNLSYWTAASNTWTSAGFLTGEELRWITVDPSNTQRMFVGTAASNGWRHSANGGTNWTSVWNNNAAGAHAWHGATDIKWQGDWPSGGYAAGSPTYGDSADGMRIAVFNPATGSLWAATGIGTFEATAPLPTTADTSRPTWLKLYERSIGLEMLLVSDIVYPPGGKPIYSVWDRQMIRIEDHKRYTNQPRGYRYGDLDVDGTLLYSTLNLGESLAYAPDNPDIILATVEYNDQVHCMSLDGGVTWPKLLVHPDGYARWSQIVARNANEAIWVCGANGRMVYTTNLQDPTPTWLPVQGANVPIPSYAYKALGTSNGQILYQSKALYAPNISGGVNNSAQFIAVTINAASGTGSVVDNAGAKTCVVTPPSGTTTATALCAYINANSTLITAAPTGTGASAFSTGTVTLQFTAGFGWSGFEGVNRYVQTDKNGNIVLFNSMTGTGYNNLSGIWYLPAGADFITGWVQKGGFFSPSDNGPWIELVENGTSAPTEIFAKQYAQTGGLLRSTDSGVSFGTVPLTTACSALSVGPVPPGKTRPCVAFAGKYNGTYGVWLWEGTDPSTDVPMQLCGHPLNNLDSVAVLEFNPHIYDDAPDDPALLYGGFGGSGGFRIIPTDTKTLT